MEGGWDGEMKEDGGWAAAEGVRKFGGPDPGMAINAIGAHLLGPGSDRRQLVVHAFLGFSLFFYSGGEADEPSQSCIIPS